MKCPCCGHDIEDVPREALLAMPWSPIEGAIIRRLVKSYPERATVDQMLDAIYGTRNDQPDFATTSMHVILMRLRKKLAEVGWSVPKMRGGKGPIYRLEKIQ